MIETPQYPSLYQLMKGETDKLKPCPFCGEADISITHHYGANSETTDLYVWCPGCATKIIFCDFINSSEDISDAWNKRK